MNFSQALDAMKQRKKVTRTGWHGKEMAAFLVPPLRVNDQRSEQAYFVLRLPDGVRQPGWVPSTLDLLSDDWEEVV